MQRMGISHVFCRYGIIRDSFVCHVLSTGSGRLVGNFCFTPFSGDFSAVNFDVNVSVFLALARDFFRKCDDDCWRRDMSKLYPLSFVDSHEDDDLELDLPF